METDDIAPNSQTFRGLRLQVDQWDYSCLNGVLPIVAGEQDIICDYCNVQPRERVLDVGTGSGAIALYAASHGADATGIDKSSRAINSGRHSAAQNNLKCNFVLGTYSEEMFSPESFDCIIMNPPHHPTHPDTRMPFYADGGIHGYDVCFEWIQTALRHVAPTGRIVFFQLSPIINGAPVLIKSIRKNIPAHAAISFAPVLPRISSTQYIRQTYLSQESLMLNYTQTHEGIELLLGEISLNQPTQITASSQTFDYGDTWPKRLRLLRNIAVKHNSCLQTNRKPPVKTALLRSQDIDLI
ncbi:MAG: methyltransferase [Alphaproteobacteria bacterium]|nr:methyltransferase [Alphaproteobacteria bacterium]